MSPATAPLAPDALLDLLDAVLPRLDGAGGEGTRGTDAARGPDLDGLVHALVPRLADACALRLVVPAATGAPEVTTFAAGAAIDAGDLERLDVPVVAPGGPEGTLRLGRARPFTPAEVRLVRTLARHVAQVLAAHQRAAQRVREALDAREKILSIVSHDLKNPLQVVVWNTRQLRRHADKGDAVPSDAVRRCAEWFEGASRKLTTIVDALLDAARLQAGKRLPLEAQLVDLGALVRRVADEHQQDTSRHTFILTTGSGEVVGRWDARRLERVLGALVGNAVKYSPMGGDIRLTLAREDATASEGEASGWAVLRIEDQGIGVPPDERERIFQWFQRASNVPRHLDGAGLGLPTARLVCEQHGGRLDLDDRPGPGATFVLRLPLASP